MKTRLRSAHCARTMCGHYSRRGCFMSWKGSRWSKTAEHVESGTKFSILWRSNRIDGIDDIDIEPIGNDGKRWSSEELLQLKADLWAHWEHQRFRDELHSLIQNNLFGECDRAANAISSISGKKVSNRTIQSWLIALDKPSSRTCPPWAVKALKAYLDDPKNGPELEWLQQKRKEADHQFQSVVDITWSRSVEMATREIETEERDLESWKKTGLTELPEKLFKEFWRLEREISGMSRALATISRGIETAESYEQLKALVSQELREARWTAGEIRRTRRAIEEGLEEFANPEGLAD